MDDRITDFTPVLELEYSKAPDWYRVYILTSTGWKSYSKHRNEMNARIVKDVKEGTGNQIRITYKRRVIYPKPTEGK